MDGFGGFTPMRKRMERVVMSPPHLCEYVQIISSSTPTLDCCIQLSKCGVNLLITYRGKFLPLILNSLHSLDEKDFPIILSQ